MRPYVVRIEAQEIKRDNDSSTFAVYRPDGSTKFYEVTSEHCRRWRCDQEDALYHIIHEDMRYDTEDDFFDFRLDVTYL